MCVKKQGRLLITPVHDSVIFTTSGATKEPGIDPGLTEKPDPSTEEPGPTTGSTSQGEKGTYERASHSV